MKFYIKNQKTGELLGQFTDFDEAVVKLLEEKPNGEGMIYPNLLGYWVIFTTNPVDNHSIHLYRRTVDLDGEETIKDTHEIRDSYSRMVDVWKEAIADGKDVPCYERDQAALDIMEEIAGVMMSRAEAKKEFDLTDADLNSMAINAYYDRP